MTNCITVYLLIVCLPQIKYKTRNFVLFVAVFPHLGGNLAHSWQSVNICYWINKQIPAHSKIRITYRRGKKNKCAYPISLSIQPGQQFSHHCFSQVTTVHFYLTKSNNKRLGFTKGPLVESALPVFCF